MGDYRKRVQGVIISFRIKDGCHHYKSNTRDNPFVLPHALEPTVKFKINFQNNLIE